MEENKDIREELEGTAPELSKLKRKDPFEAPMDYFEELPSAIQDRILARKDKQRDYTLARRWVPAFAILLILLTGGLLLFRNAWQQPSVQPIAQVQPNTVNVDTQIALSDPVLDVLDEEVLVQAVVDNSVVKPVTNKVQAEEENLEEYILDNYDESILIEEL